MHFDLNSCFHGIMRSFEVEELLLSKDVSVGAFMLWKTNAYQVDYILSVKEQNNKCIHLLAPSASSGNFFKTTLLEIVEYYRKNPLDCSKLKVKLTQPVLKSTSTNVKSTIVIATCDYSPTEFSHLKFRQGDELHLLDTENPNWWYAKNGNDIGYIPAKYFRPEAAARTVTGNKKASFSKKRDIVPRVVKGQSSTGQDSIAQGNGMNSTKPRISPTEANSNTEKVEMKFTSYNGDIDLENGGVRPKPENLSFVRGILENFKKLRSPSSSSPPAELEGYRGFPVDDDIFDLSVESEKLKTESKVDVVRVSSERKGKLQTVDRKSKCTLSTSSDDDVISLDHESDGSDVQVTRNRPIPTYFYDRDVYPLPYRPSSTLIKGISGSTCDTDGNDVTHNKNQDVPGPRMRREKSTSATQATQNHDEKEGNVTPSENSRQTKAKSYYISGDELAPEVMTRSPGEGNFFKNFWTVSDDDVSNADSGVDNSYCGSSKCLPVTVNQVCEVWGEVGPAGGVIQVPGTGASLHLSPNGGKTKKLSNRSSSSLKTHAVSFHRPGKSRMGSKMGEKYKSASDLSTLANNAEPEKDGRIVIGLEDPPDDINERTQVVAGPMVRVDYANADVIKAGAVLQIDINVMLKDSAKDYSDGDCQQITSSPCGDSRAKVACQFACLQSENKDGPFHEISGSYYHYGNTLQVTIATKKLLPLEANSGQEGRLFLVPIAKLQRKHRANPFFNVWDGIARKIFWVGVYGSKKLQMLSTCCVTLSSSGTCPPTLWVRLRDNKKVLLHLWGSYHLPIDEMQDLHVSLQPEDSSPLVIAPYEEKGAELISEERDLRQKSRITRIFSLHNKNCTGTQLGETNGALNGCGSPNAGFKQKNHLFITLTGLRDGTMYQMQVSTPEPERDLVSSTPVKRWKRTKPIEPPKTMLERRTAHTEEYLYLWHDSQKESKVKLRPAFKIPGANRQITPARLAVALKSRIRGKGHSMVMPHLAQYNQSDVLPILGAETFPAHGTTKYKDWFVGYSQRKIGLIHNKCVRMVTFSEYCNWTDPKLTVSRVIENIIGPIGRLSYCHSTIRDALMKEVKNWVLFASILRFGENYVEKVMAAAEDESDRETNDKISLFLEKFKEYCATGPRKRCFHKEIIRALLYMEHYDVVISLLSDFCLLSVSVEVGKRWSELVTKLREIDDFSTEDAENTTKRGKRLKSEDNDEKVGKEVIACHDIDKNELIEEATWRPAFDFLSCWRRKFGTNHRAFLLYLHRAVDELPDSPHKTWQPFTGAMILLFAMDTLRTYDTRL